MLSVCSLLGYCVPTKPIGTPDHCDPAAPGTPQCCVDANCTDIPGHDGDGTCTALTACGGPMPPPGGMSNVCVWDECDFSPDVRGGDGQRSCEQGLVCLPGGFPNKKDFPRNHCVQATCTDDSGCDDETQSGGMCQPFFGNMRCGKYALQGFYCSYDQSECRVDQDCSSLGPGRICVYNATTSEPQCQRVAPPPPTEL